MALKPPVEVPQGAIRLNTDSQKLEFYAQDQWWEMATDVANLGDATNSDIAGGGRGIYGGMTPDASAAVTALDFITIPTAGDAKDFGDLSVARIGLSAYSSRTRGVFHSGLSKNEIDYVTIASTGTSLDFGDISDVLVRYPTGLSNQIRGLLIGGYDGSAARNEMRYVTIAATGDLSLIHI